MSAIASMPLALHHRIIAIWYTANTPILRHYYYKLIIRDLQSISERWMPTPWHGPHKKTKGNDQLSMYACIEDKEIRRSTRPTRMIERPVSTMHHTQTDKPDHKVLSPWTGGLGSPTIACTPHGYIATSHHLYMTSLIHEFFNNWMACQGP